MKKNQFYNRYILTIYRYALLATAQLLYIIAAFMPVLQAVVDVCGEYFDVLATETGKAVVWFNNWFSEAMEFRAEICRENREGEYA